MKTINYLLLALFLIPMALSQETCSPANTPKITTPVLYTASVGSPFFADINTTTERATFNLIPFSGSAEVKISKEDGTIYFTPKKAETLSMLIVATTDKGCYDTKKIQIFVNDRPHITEKSPEDDRVEIRETEHVRFYVNASSSQALGHLTYQWYLDSSLIGAGNSYTYYPDFSGSGTHVIKAFAKDSKGLNTSVQWILSVSNKNRAPYVKYNLPYLGLSEKKSTPYLNVYDYIYDPDYDRLTFTPIFVDKTKEYIFNLTFDTSGYMYITWETGTPTAVGIILNASDGEESVATAPFFIKVAAPQNFTYFLLNSSVNQSEDCKVEIICNEWSKCLSEGVRVRDCYDYNNCNWRYLVLPEFEVCEYNASCSDNLKNQGEEGVDCGGPCVPCASCTDKIKNQNEEETDCGGVCKPCPSCIDGMKNQDETDIDCGGRCPGCSEGMKCKQHGDCESYICSSKYLCDPSTCTDSRKNQGEEGIDCGGPCSPCETCSDKLCNNNEDCIKGESEKPDCGGPCKKCETCFDRIRNQGEILTDCGGPCKSCDFTFLFISFRNIIIVLLIILIFGGTFIITKRRYENDKVGFLADFSSRFSFLPKNLPENSRDIFLKAENELETIKQDIMTAEEAIIRERYLKTINEFYSSLFEIEGIVGESLLRMVLKDRIKNPFLAALFMESYVQASKTLPEKAFFKIELEERIIYLLKILSKIEGFL